MVASPGDLGAFVKNDDVGCSRGATVHLVRRERVSQLEKCARPFRPALFVSGSYQKSLDLVHKGARTFQTTSIGRLFDAAAALLGFTGEVSFEGQAMSVEHPARKAELVDTYPIPFTGHELDFRPLLQSVIAERLCARDISQIARAFQAGLARAIFAATRLQLWTNREVPANDGGLSLGQCALAVFGDPERT